ncbi:MAG: heme A synthase [Chloroflexi bacterium]|nr:heme A synthase [Chloroflexota bacterium]
MSTSTRAVGRIQRISASIPLRTLGWMALVLAAVTAGLITYGSWVRVSGSGLGCPDWPLCNGGVVPKQSVAQVIEYGHRLFAGITMLATWALAFVLYKRRVESPRASLFLIAASVLILAQALLGGATVLTDLSGWVRLAHLGFSMSALGATTAGALTILAKDWEEPKARLPVLPLILIAISIIMVGGSIVATKSSFGCTTLPLCDHPATDTAKWLHTFHRTLGLVLGAGIVLAWLHVLIRGSNKPIRIALLGATVTVAAQMSVGAFAITQHLPNGLRIAHLGLAASVWWALVSLWVLATAQYGEATSTRESDAALAQGSGRV